MTERKGCEVGTSPAQNHPTARVPGPFSPLLLVSEGCLQPCPEFQISLQQSPQLPELKCSPPRYTNNLPVLSAQPQQAAPACFKLC